MGAGYIKRMLVLRALEGGLIIVLIGAIYVLSDKIQSVRREYAVQQMQLDQSLSGVVHRSSLASELERRGHDLNRIRAVVPAREAVGDVVNAIAGEAQARAVTVQVPEIVEETAGEPGSEEDGGQLSAVRLKVVAVGDAAAVLQFFHSVENLPYLLGVDSFDFSGATFTAPGTAALRPVSLPDGEEEPAATPAPSSELRMEIVLSTLSSLP